MKPDGFIFLVLIGAALVALKFGWKTRMTIVLSVIIYLTVNSYFYGLVRRASTHGNTIHGWYSKYNSGEKTLAWLWFIGFPAGGAFAGLYLFERHERQKKSNEDQASKQKGPSSKA